MRRPQRKAYARLGQEAEWRTTYLEPREWGAGGTEQKSGKRGHLDPCETEQKLCGSGSAFDRMEHTLEERTQQTPIPSRLLLALLAFLCDLVIMGML